MKNLFLLLLLCVLAPSYAFAQVDYGGEPLSWSENAQINIPNKTMAPIDIEALKREDEVNAQHKDRGYRFGKNHSANINYFDEALQSSLNNVSIYQLALTCPEALSVNLTFDAFHIPEGASLFIYNEDRSQLKGAYTSQSNRDSGIFPVGIVKGEKIIIEYNGDPNGAILHISQVTHGYKDVLKMWQQRGPFGDSDPCQVNINCPEGNAWQDQKRSVALILEGGSNVCSGALVNNTLEDGTPYFLTANHCLGDPNAWVYYFNHESDTCDGDTGPTDQSIAGGTLKATRTLSDFALIELSENIPEDYNVYFSGWDNSDIENVTNSVAIHHPSGDVKKISFDNQSPSKILNTGDVEVWEITNWERGSTEGGSSGSPLYNQNGRIIGQLLGGNARCYGPYTGGYYDYFGRVGVSWNGPSDSERLIDWLDPNDSGVNILNGYGPNDVALVVDASNNGLTLPEVICSEDPLLPSFKLKNNGSTELTSATIESTYNGTTQAVINWTGSLAQNEIEIVDLNLFTPIIGMNNLEAIITSANGTVDDNAVNNSAAISKEVVASIDVAQTLTITVTTDQYAYETNWRITDENSNDIANGGLFSEYDPNSTYTETVTLPAIGCYQFRIVDNYGDGMCCAYGDGGYVITNSNGVEIASGGDFDDVEIVILNNVSELGVETSDVSNLISVYPNPTDGIVHITTAALSGDYTLKLLNINGQLVNNETITSNTTKTMDLSAFAAGVYLVEISNNQEKITKKIVVY